MILPYLLRHMSFINKKPAKITADKAPKQILKAISLTESAVINFAIITATIERPHHPMVL